jgi:hypothetical protein
MRSDFCKFWISVFGLAVVTSVPGCGGNGAPGASSPPTPSVDPNVAFEHYLDSLTPFKCSNAYDAMTQLANAGKVGNAKVYAKTYRDLEVTWNDELGKIAFPHAAQPIVDRIHELNVAELTDLDAVIALVDEQDTTKMNGLVGNVYYDEAVVAVELDRLAAALGRPESRSRIALDDWDLAYQTLYREDFPVSPMWKSALARNDLAGAKAANSMEEAALQRYLDRLGTIDWPAGFEDQVNTLRDKLRGLIEFDRRQVDVAAVAQIDSSPENGAAETRAVTAAKAALEDGLQKLAAKTDPPAPKC